MNDANPSKLNSKLKYFQSMNELLNRPMFEFIPYNLSMEEKRKYLRYLAVKNFGVYAEDLGPKFSVKTKDISEKGAYMLADNLPKKGSFISLDFLDESLHPQYSTKAKVVRLLKTKAGEKGFCVDFEEEVPKSFLKNYLN